MRTIPALYLASYALSLLGNSIAAATRPLLIAALQLNARAFTFRSFCLSFVVIPRD